MVRKLVVAVDDSAVSKSTLQWAAEKLLRPDDELHIISVLEPASGGNFASTAETAYPVSMQEVRRARGQWVANLACGGDVAFMTVELLPWE